MLDVKKLRKDLENSKKELTAHQSSAAVVSPAQKGRCWRRVADELPEENSVVLGWNGIELLTYGFWDNKWWDYENARSKTPTHWMPLPEPPAEG